MAKDIGATGEFPEGKIHGSDEGQVRFAIAHDKGKVIIQFGKPIAWFAMGPEQARELADTLTKHAIEAERDYQ
jgi:hypothetical protein